MKLLIIAGAVLVILSLALGWLLVAKRYLSLSAVNRIIRDDTKIVKCHVEYILMALLLFAFYFLRFDLPLTLVISACAGAFLNPSLFLVLAIKPDIRKNVGSPFSVISTFSFILTTFGFGASALLVLYRVIP